MIELKSGVDVNDFLKISPKLLIILGEASLHLQNHGISPMVITSLIRPHTNDSGVHSCGRGADIRTIGYESKIMDRLVEYLNKTFVYDIYRAEKKTAMIHAVEGNVSHLHVQVNS